MGASGIILHINIRKMLLDEKLQALKADSPLSTIHFGIGCQQISVSSLKHPRLNGPAQRGFRPCGNLPPIPVRSYTSFLWGLFSHCVHIALSKYGELCPRDVLLQGKAAAR